MAALTDEILMVYADGLLDAEAAAQIEALLKADPGARARVSMFRATGRVLSEPYDEVLREPVPARLTGFVMNYGKERQDSPAPASQAPEGRLIDFVMSHGKERQENPARASQTASSPMRAAPSLASRRRRPAGLRERLIPNGAGWHLAAASAAALIVGVSAGFLLRGESEGGLGPSLAELRQGQALASGALYQVLETQPSNQTAEAVLTFKTKEGGYCREYKTAIGQSQFQGLACRDAGGHWAVQVHAAQQAAVPGTRIAGRSEALNAAVEDRVDGIAFGKDEEEAAIKSGWK